MNVAHPLLAALEDNQQVLHQKISISTTSQMAIIFGAIGVLIVLMFLFVYAFRKRLLRKRKRRYHEHQSSASSTPQEEQPKRRKWRRPRREHRPLNPTLAQSGGLPPVRDPEQPPPGL